MVATMTEPPQRLERLPSYTSHHPPSTAAQHRQISTSQTQTQTHNHRRLSVTSTVTELPSYDDNRTPYRNPFEISQSTHESRAAILRPHKLIYSTANGIAGHSKHIRAAILHAITANDLPLANILFRDDDIVSNFGQIFETRDGCLPLHIAASYNNIDVARIILNHGSKLGAVRANQGNVNRTPPLFYAVEKGHVEMVLYLLDQGAKVNMVNTMGWTATYIAVKHQNENILDILIQKGGVVTVPDVEGWTSLHFVARNGHLSILYTLIEAGAIIDAKNSYGRTPLHEAVVGGDIDVVRALLDVGASLKEEARDGMTAFDVAVSLGRQDVMRLLLEAEPNLGPSRKEKVEEKKGGFLRGLFR